MSRKSKKSKEKKDSKAIPTEELEIKSSSNADMKIGTKTDTIEINAKKLVIKSEGKVGHGSPSPEEVKKYQDGIALGMNRMLEKFDFVIKELRFFRKKIDFIMKLIELSGMQNEIASRVKQFNPVEHTISNLVLAKGGFGELLKLMIPAEELIGMKCYTNYLKICKDIGEKPVFGEDKIYPFLGNDYMSEMFKTIRKSLLEDISLEENHNLWMKARKDAGWVYGKVKDAEKKTSPSLIPYDELPESDIRKNEEFQRIIKEYKNPYKYPKQIGSDVEDVVDSVVIDNISEVKIPEGMYTKNGIELKKFGELNSVQKVDFIKYLIAKLLHEFIEFKFSYLFSEKLQMFNKYSDKKADMIILSGVTVQGTYTSLVNAKNMFGYTFQYYK